LFIISGIIFLLCNCDLIKSLIYLLSIRKKINVYSRLVLFPLYFTKFSLNTVSIRVKFWFVQRKIMTRRMYIYLIPDTKYQEKINVYSRLVLFPLYFTKFSLNTVSIRVKFWFVQRKIMTRRMYIYLIPDTKYQEKINVYSRLVLFPLYFTKFSLNTVSIRVKFGSSKEK